MDMHHEIAALRAALPTMSERDASFAQSLLDSHETRGLSEKQAYWVRKLAAPKAAPVTTDVGDFSGVIALFQAAREKLKFPKIRLSFDGGKPLVLSVAGPAAKAPGTVNVTDGGKFGENTWYGRVDMDGKFAPSSKVDAASMTALTTVLAALAKDPARVASKFGRLTGNCVFCARALTDARSVKVGYGETCASNYSLPWGE